MKWTFVTAALFSLSITGFSQQPVKVNLLEYFDKVVPPPATAKEAYEKCGCNHPDREGRCSADSLFKGMSNSLEKIQMEISSSGGGTQAEMMKKMQDPEFKKKMKKMTKEEKMKLAMEMQAANAATMGGPMRPEPEPVMVVLREMGKLSEWNAKESQNVNTIAQAQIKHEQELDAKHNAVDEWETAEIKKLPIIHTGGEGDDGPDPKAVYLVKTNAFKRHLAIVEEELKRSGSAWVESREKDKEVFASYEKGLEKIHFGDDAKNQSTKSNLAVGQTLIIGRLVNLIGGSQHMFNEAAGWYDRYVQFQKTKPE